MKSKPLWKPKAKEIESSLLNLFFNHLEKNNYLKNNRIFLDLWNWTIKNPDIFWSEFCWGLNLIVQVVLDYMILKK